MIVVRAILKCGFLTITIDYLWKEMHMNSRQRRTCSQIDLNERRKIERWRQADVSVDEIAELTG